MKAAKISETLKSFYNGELTSDKAAEKIKEADPLDISLAEIDLMSEGFEEKDLKKITEVFLKVIEDKKEKYKKNLDNNHPIRKFISDHEEIVERIEKIENILEDRKNLKCGEEKYIRKNFREFEKHHRLEEKTILPMLEKNGKRGRVHLVKNEHRKIEREEKKVNILIDDEKISSAKDEVELLRYQLNEHTIMENNYLYPIAFERIDDWASILDKLEDMEKMDLPRLFRVKREL